MLTAPLPSRSRLIIINKQHDVTGILPKNGKSAAAESVEDPGASGRGPPNPEKLPPPADLHVRAAASEGGLAARGNIKNLKRRVGSTRLLLWEERLIRLGLGVPTRNGRDNPGSWASVPGANSCSGNPMGGKRRLTFHGS